MVAAPAVRSRIVKIRSAFMESSLAVSIERTREAEKLAHEKGPARGRPLILNRVRWSDHRTLVLTDLQLVRLQEGWVE